MIDDRESDDNTCVLEDAGRLYEDDDDVLDFAGANLSLGENEGDALDAFPGDCVVLAAAACL